MQVLTIFVLSSISSLGLKDDIIGIQNIATNVAI